MNIIDVPLEQIAVKKNDRTTFADDEIAALAKSIDAVGLLSPITLEPRTDGEPGYWLVAGERRFRAHQWLAELSIPAIVTAGSNEEARLKMLAENVGRVDLDPLDEARAYQENMDSFDLLAEEVAERVGVSPTRVRARLALLRLNPEVQMLVSKKRLLVGIAQCMVDLDADRQRVALRAWATGKLGSGDFVELCSTLLAEQQQTSIFDPGSFLVLDTYVQEAQAKNKHLHPKQMSTLFELILDGFEQLVAPADVPPDLAAMVARSRASIEFRLRKPEKASG